MVETSPGSLSPLDFAFVEDYDCVNLVERRNTGVEEVVGGRKLWRDSDGALRCRYETNRYV